MRFALRQLTKHKGSSIMAILILALGIGGTTAVFSVADKVLLRPIPGPHRDRLVTVREVEVAHDWKWQVCPPVIREIGQHTGMVADVAYWPQFIEDKKMMVDGKQQKIRGAQVSPNFFEVMELRSMLGRTFRPEEGEDGTAKTIILGHGFWQRQFGGDRQILGRTVSLDDDFYTVIGVMPPNVQYPFTEGHNEFWVPYRFTSQQLNQEFAPRDRMYETLVLLREGVTVEEFQSWLDVVAARRAPTLNEPTKRWTIQAQPARFSFSHAVLQRTVWTLLAMMGALLIIACSNVGNILLSRALARRGEISVRMALGAGRLRIARELFMESLCLSGIAAALGVFLAWGGIKTLEQFYLSGLRRINTIGMDIEVLGITCLFGLAAALLFGTAPAWLAARTHVNQALKESAQQHSGGKFLRLLHDGLVVVQVSVAVTLLTGAGLMIRSVVTLLQVDPGLEAAGLYRVFYDAIDFMNTPAYDVKAALARGVARPVAIQEYNRAQLNHLTAFQRVALERLRAIPGVHSVAVNNGPGFSDYAIEGELDPVFLGHATAHVKSDDFLRTVGAKLVRGRLLNEEDAQPGRVGAVINETMANLCWPGKDPLGRKFHDLDDRNEFYVVGVIQGIRDFQLESELKPVFYEPGGRPTDFPPVGDYIVRSDGAAESLREGIVKAGRSMMVPVELNHFYSIEAKLFESTAPRRIMMWLFITLGSLGLLLSAMGIFAVLSYSTARREREVGIRMAVGADRQRVRNLFLRRGVRLLVNGLVLGVVTTIGLGYYFESLLYRVPPQDPVTLVAVALLLAGAGGLASWLPARRVANLDPMEALRHE